MKKILVLFLLIIQGCLFIEPLSLALSDNPKSGYILFSAPTGGQYRLGYSSNTQPEYQVQGSGYLTFPSSGLDLMQICPNEGDAKQITVRVKNENESKEISFTARHDPLPALTDSTGPNGILDPVVSLGANYQTDKTIFRIWSPDSTYVRVKIESTVYPMSIMPSVGIYTDIYEVIVNEDLIGKPYQFQVGGNPVRDPYGKMIINNPSHSYSGYNVVLDLSIIGPAKATMDTNRPALSSPTDSIIYESHIRDFTIHSSSGVSLADRGRYKGYWSGGTTDPSNPSTKTGIDHLVELGITHVQLLPFYDFASKTYNWGYDPYNYNIPEESYSSLYESIPYGSSYGAQKDLAVTTADFQTRIGEVKTMVDELHKKGIRVIMDVVYNHTYSTSMFNSITKSYYDGQNLSGCGNSIDGKNPLVRRFIRDSLEYWASYYGVDGFRFDLLGIFYQDAARDWGAYLNQKYPTRGFLLYGEPWNGYASDPNERQKIRLGNIGTLVDQGIGAFNPKFRETIKGDNDGTGTGYAFGAASIGQAADIARGVIGSGVWPGNWSAVPKALSDSWDRMYTWAPFQTINYVSAHDNLCLWDKVNKAGAGLSTIEKVKVNNFSSGIILTSLGIPFLHSGDELLRTKNMNHNSYNAGDADNAINWTNKTNNSGVFQYYKSMVALRKENPEFHINTYTESRTKVLPNTLTSGWDQSIADDKHVATTFLDSSGSPKIIVIYNPDSAVYIYQAALPAGTWKLEANATGKLSSSTDVTSGSVTCDARSVTVLKKY